MEEKVENCPICRRCHRKLKTLEAQERGFGRICWEKMQKEKEPKPLFTVKNGD